MIELNPRRMGRTMEFLHSTDRKRFFRSLEILADWLPHSSNKGSLSHALTSHRYLGLPPARALGLRGCAGARDRPESDRPPDSG